MPLPINENKAPRPEEAGNKIDQIIGYRPHWLIRYGNLAFLFLILILAFASFFINYPDPIELPVKIITGDSFQILDEKTIYSKDVFYGQIITDRNTADRIHSGNRVSINFNKPAFAGPGNLSGIVSRIFLLPKNRDSVLIMITLPEQSISNNNKQRAFKENMAATAQINSGNQKLAAYLGKQFKEIFKRN
jgi:hypothetical protein